MPNNNEFEIENNNNKETKWLKGLTKDQSESARNYAKHELLAMRRKKAAEERVLRVLREKKTMQLMNIPSNIYEQCYDFKCYPIHYALKNKLSSEIILQLLEASPESAKKTARGYYLPLYYALENKDVELNVIDKLIELYPESVFINRGASIYYAISNCVSVEIINRLLDLFEENKKSLNNILLKTFNCYNHRNKEDINKIVLRMLDIDPEITREIEDHTYHLPITIALRKLLDIEIINKLLDITPVDLYYRKHEYYKNTKKENYEYETKEYKNFYISEIKINQYIKNEKYRCESWIDMNKYDCYKNPLNCILHDAVQFNYPSELIQRIIDINKEYIKKLIQEIKKRESIKRARYRILHRIKYNEEEKNNEKKENKKIEDFYNNRYWIKYTIAYRKALDFAIFNYKDAYKYKYDNLLERIKNNIITLVKEYPEALNIQCNYIYRLTPLMYIINNKLFDILRDILNIEFTSSNNRDKLYNIVSSVVNTNNFRDSSTPENIRNKISKLKP